MSENSGIQLRACGLDVIIYSLARILSPEMVSLGNSVTIDDFTMLQGGQGITIGDFVHIAAFAGIIGGGSLVMGSFGAISGGVRVWTGTDDASGNSLIGARIPGCYRRPYRAEMLIGDHVLIGSNSVVMPGVHIGQGAVIGAMSFVNSDVPEWTICYGIPARPRRDRPKERILEMEAELRWEVYQDGRYIPAAERGPTG